MKIRLAASFLLGVLLGSAILAARDESAAPVMFNPSDPAFAPVTDSPGLPRVLLLGDSISIGYTPLVQAGLKGRANVHRARDNCRQTAYGLANLDRWLGAGRWDVIHFNFGLHDLKYIDDQGRYVPPEKGRQVASPEEYGKNLLQLVARLKKTGAKLIFATTTPVPAGTDGRVKDDERRFNAVAIEVMKESGVAVDDLWSLAAARQAQIQQPHNVHFTPEGYRELSELVVRSVAKALPPR